MTLESSSDKIGTGTKIVVRQGDDVVNEFEAVIFGDMTGDGWYDGNDAYFVRLAASGMISPDAFTDSQRAACDVNHDGTIDEADALIVESAGLLLNDIDQTATNDALITNDVFIEYCDLIDQGCAAVAPAENPAQAAASIWQIVMDLFKRVVAYIASLFSIIVIPK